MISSAVRPTERHPLPDILRGLAILGILWVNMQDFAGYDEWRQHGADRVAQVVIDVLFNGRFISIFAMLFGAGVAALLARHDLALLLRRLLVLLALGSLHAVLLWHGDIIASYALLGLLLLVPLTLRLSSGRLTVLAAALGAYWLLARSLEALAVPALHRWTTVQRTADLQHYLPLVQQRASSYLSTFTDNLLYNAPWLLCLLLLGAAAQQAGVLQRPAEHRPLLRRLAWGGVALGVPLGLLLAWLNSLSTAQAGYWAVPVRMSGGLALGLGYVGLVGLAVAAGQAGGLRRFAAAGQLALTHYLTQSLLMTTLFYPYGLGLYARLGALPCLLIALALGAVQLWISAPLLRRFRRGPMEALLRRVVYGR
ncbi:DUF418 domain-containing protein [Deinococcus sonorensis]|uniref:DUF418 domain-containing protein n=2 Tax=Deinococcus sonorensis TaxID=309891 RepID=A0AAU7UFK0_9DEIO